MEIIAKTDENGYTDVEVPGYHGSGETYEEAEQNANNHTTNPGTDAANMKSWAMIVVFLIFIFGLLGAYVSNRDNKKE